MAMVIKRSKFGFKIVDVWFSDDPYDIDGCDKVTFHACKRKVEVKGFEYREFATLVIDLTRDLSDIWQDMGKSSCRYSIKRAEREGICVKVSQDYQWFYRLNRRFREEKGLPKHHGDGPEEMAKYGTLFSAEYKEDLLSGQLYAEDKNNIRWLLGASKRLEVNREEAALIGCANRLIIWQAIKYAKEKGIREFDFGGYFTGIDRSDPRYNINTFKDSFGGKLTTHYIYEKDYSKIYRIAKKVYRLLRFNYPGPRN